MAQPVARRDRIEQQLQFLGLVRPFDDDKDIGIQILQPRSDQRQPFGNGGVFLLLGRLGAAHPFAARFQHDGAALCGEQVVQPFHVPDDDFHGDHPLWPGDCH